MTVRAPDKLCDWPPPGCREPVWFKPTDSGLWQVVDADGTDHHATCKAWLAQLERERAERAAELAAQPTLFEGDPT